MPHNVILYTDGAARGNPGPGGFGVVLLSGKHRKEISQGFRHTTNNRMELLAVITGLEALKKDNCNVSVYTDSRYVTDAIQKGWVNTWERKRFAGKKNPDLWIRLLKIFRQHQVTIYWIKGHAENVENERCDELAVAASFGNDLPEDHGYICD
jgi:ribonuclease HI